jgi:hypothetical protein
MKIFALLKISEESKKNLKHMTRTKVLFKKAMTAQYLITVINFDLFKKKI